MALKQVKETLRRALPQPVFNALKQAYGFSKPAKIDKVQTTIYFCTPNCRTYIGVNNFYSWLGADHVVNAQVWINFYNTDGEVVLVVKKPLGFFESCVLDVRELFQQHRISTDFGIFTVSVKPRNPWNPAVKRIGDSTAIFYCLYRDANGSIALIHPNARIGNVEPFYNWTSLQVISTDHLSKIVLHQMHGGDYEHESTYYLVDSKTGDQLAAKTAHYKPFGSAQVSFRIDEFKHIPPELMLKADSLPSSNAKPLLQRVFNSGLFSISHS
jgi:hypothetical protein